MEVGTVIKLKDVGRGGIYQWKTLYPNCKFLVAEKLNVGMTLISLTNTFQISSYVVYWAGNKLSDWTLLEEVIYLGQMPTFNN